jgi:TolB protein
MRPDGTGQKQLTVNARSNATPAVTPDNHYIVFTSNRTGSSQIWRMNLDSSNQVQLTDRADSYYPSISPDGKWVVYNTTDDWHLWRVSIEGGEPTLLTDYIATWPAVSPDGKMIACMGRNQSRREILILPFEGGQPLKKIELDAGDFPMSRVQWTPNGKGLIYASARHGSTALLKQPLDGSPPAEIMDVGEDELFDFGYSFDGQSLAVTRGGWQTDVVLISDW